MNTITDKLADALRALIDECETSADFGDTQGRGHQSELDALDAANAALAEYDAQRALANDGPLGFRPLGASRAQSFPTVEAGGCAPPVIVDGLSPVATVYDAMGERPRVTTNTGGETA